jgi:hypothetical protein
MIGKSMAHYKNFEKIGEGGMGVSHKVRMQRSHARVGKT